MKNRMSPHAALMARPVRRVARATAVLTVLLSSALAGAQTASSQKADKGEIQRGRYLVMVAGCNDCHTPGYAAKNGEVDEKLWLTGDALGWSGPWGTTYPVNLRLFMADMSKQQWVKHARTMTPRPPMPWFNVRPMTDADLKAIYAYTRSLGRGGDPAPAFVPPGANKPGGPLVQFPG
ncbi:cytochrome c [Variovorax paradoxus]|nr:cytochrome c [Variovorax paradoxus]